MPLLLALALVVAVPGIQQNPAPKAPSARKAALGQKVSGLLEQTKFKHRKAGDGVWVISFSGDHTSSLEVVVQALDDMVLVFSTVKKQVTASAPQLRQLLEANYKANYAKVAIDEDGDLLALTELSPDLTSAMLRTAVDEVANLTDAAAGVLFSESRPAPSTEKFESVPSGTGATLSLVRGSFQLSYDPAKWKPEASKEANVTQLNHVSGEAWVKVIGERLEVAPDSLRDLAISNAKNITPDVTVDSETWGTVNGLKVLVLRYNVTTSGVRFTFYNQMYSDADGLVQLAGWAPRNLFAEYQRDLQELFAGLRKKR